MKRLPVKTALLLILILIFNALPISASAEAAQKLIALTFDDGPGKYTQELLDGLRERGVRVSFFVLGQNVKSYPETVRRAWEEGHQICCHTYHHYELTRLSDDDIRRELELTDAAIDEALGHDFDYWLRPPYGSHNKHVLSLTGVPCFYWSVDTRDWESLNSDAAYKEFMRAAKDGSIVLMHDIHKTTIPAALRAIDTLMADGYEFVTVSELLSRRGIEAEPGKIYFSAYPEERGTEPALIAPTISYERTPEGKKVVIEGDERAKIYYTTDGQLPEPGNCEEYEQPFYIDEDTEVKAVCVRSWNGGRSDVVSETVEFSRLGAMTLSIRDGRLVIGGLGGESRVREFGIALIAACVAGLGGAVFGVSRTVRRKKVASRK